MSLGEARNKLARAVAKLADLDDQARRIPLPAVRQAAELQHLVLSALLDIVAHMEQTESEWHSRR